MVESPETLIYIEPLESNEADATLRKDPDLLVVKQQPITSSWRSVIMHLRARGGKRSCFRGLSLFCVSSFSMASASKFIALLPFMPSAAAQVLATILVANLEMAWTHTVISDPSPLPWFKRIPSSRFFKKIALPTAILAVARQLTVILPACLAMYYGSKYGNLEDGRNMTASEKNIIVLQVLSVLTAVLTMALFVLLPAKVMLTRVQASLLSDSEESIVPFDRSFGGHVVPEIVGGSGVLGIRDAWTTFDWNSRVRLVRAYVKVFFKQAAVTIFFTAIIFAELFLILGKSGLQSRLPSGGKGDEVTIM
jgi:hypothetical protein